MAERDVERLAAQLDIDHRPVTQALTGSQRDLIRKWRRTGRDYESIQCLLRTGTGSDQMQTHAEQLSDIINLGRTQRYVEASRGIRSATNSRIPTSLGLRFLQRGFLAVTLDRAVAIDEFTAPAGPGGSMLLRVLIGPGTRVLWVAGAGDDRLRYQCELLLHDQTIGEVVLFQYHEALPCVTIEVGE